MVEPLSPSPPKSINGFRLFISNSAFRNVLTASCISQVGNTFLSLVLMLAAADLRPGNLEAPAAASTAIGLASFIAILVGSTFIDRINYRWAMIVSDLAACLGSIVCAWSLTQGSFLGMVFSAASISVACGIVGPAWGAITPLVVDKKDLYVANASTSILMATASSLGPTLAGVVIRTLGSVYALLFDAVSFLVSAIFVFVMKPVDSPERSTGKTFWRSRKEGFSTILGSPGLRNTFLFVMIPLYFFIGMMSAIMVPFLRWIYQLDSIRVGFVQGALGVGFFCGGLIAASGMFQRMRLSSMLINGPIAYGVASLLQGLAPNYQMFAGLHFFKGLTGSPFFAAFRMLVQVESPRELLGLVLGASMSAAQAATLIGIALAPLVSRVGGLRMVMVLVGAVSSGTTLASSLWLSKTGLNWTIGGGQFADNPKPEPNTSPKEDNKGK